MSHRPPLIAWVYRSNVDPMEAYEQAAGKTPLFIVQDQQDYTRVSAVRGK